MSTSAVKSSNKRKFPPVMNDPNHQNKRRCIRNNQAINSVSTLSSMNGRPVININNNQTNNHYHRKNKIKLTPLISTNNNNNNNDLNPSHSIYKSSFESERCKTQIKLIEKLMNDIKHNNNNNNDINDSNVNKYRDCISKLQEKSDYKLLKIENELKSVEEYINNKYECQQTAWINHYNDQINEEKQKILIKYKLKFEKEKRLLLNELNQNQNKNKNKNNNNRYIRSKLWNTTTTTASHNINSWPIFSSHIMSAKWNNVCGIDNKQMENDVNQMVKNQDQNMNIIDILSLFPARKIVYKSDKNILIINDLIKNERFTIKIGEQIIIKYLKQSKMIGIVKSITNKIIWVIMRQKGDQLANQSLIKIPIQSVEEGTVKIKIL